MEIQQNVPLAPLTTLGVGGNARFFVRTASARDVEEAVAFSREEDLPLFVLGGGSNVVLAGLMVWVAIRTLQATSALQRMPDDEEEDEDE